MRASSRCSQIDCGTYYDSLKRQTTFDSFMRIMTMKAVHYLHRLCITRWVCRKGVLDATCENYNRVLQCFSLLVIEEAEGTQRRDAFYLFLHCNSDHDLTTRCTKKRSRTMQQRIYMHSASTRPEILRTEVLALNFPRPQGSL